MAVEGKYRWSTTEAQRFNLVCPFFSSKLLVRLEQRPAASGAKPLTGALAGRFRPRTGDYRVQCFVARDVVTVEKIGHRDGFYED